MTPQSISNANISQAQDLLNTQGPNAMYKYFSDLGYGYAKFADGLAEGDSFEGLAAINFLIASAESQGHPLSKDDVNTIVNEMAAAYLDALRKKVEANGESSDDISFTEAEEFHDRIFTNHDLDESSWTLKDVMDDMDPEDREVLWHDIVSNADNPTIEHAISIGVTGYMTSRGWNPKEWWWIRNAQKSMPGLFNDYSDKVVEKIKAVFRDANQTISPLVIDLDGNGVKTIPLGTTYFDFDNNGFANSTGWVDKNDGLLALDINGDGIIDNGRELFGNNTLLSNGHMAENGFIALADIDNYKDNIIDSNDTAFTNLKVWRDGNGDGISSAEEIFTLAELGITSINLVYENTNIKDDNGNFHLQSSTVIFSNNTTSNITDVWFNVDSSNTVAVETIQVTSSIELLPNVQGLGEMYDLHQAMMRDSTGILESLVTQFTNEPDADARKLLLTKILNKWAGADEYVTDSRGSYIGDGRLVYVLEAFLGESFIQWAGINEGTPNPGPNASRKLHKAYNLLNDAVYGKLMAQTHLKDVFDSIGYIWNSETHEFESDMTTVISLLKNDILNDSAPEINLLDEFLLSVRGLGLLYNLNITKIYENLVDLGPNIQTRMDSILLGYSGTSADDFLVVDESKVYINGFAGNDEITGSLGSDTIIGGIGNDILYGTQGSDRYIFRNGDGYDQILENSDKDDTLIFDNNILPTDVIFNRDSDSLFIVYNNGFDVIKVTNWFKFDAKINSILFTSDGSNISASQIEANISSPAPTNYKDVFYGTSLGESLAGLGGDDVLTGLSGNDTFIGGTGDDYINGGDGDDLYIYSAGDGNDTINNHDNSSGNDMLVFDATIHSSSVRLTRDFNNIYIKFDFVPDIITIQNWFENSQNKLDSISFTSDSLMWTENDIETIANSATSHDDFLLGTGANDLINGLQGDDLVYGMSGNDTLTSVAGKDTLDGGEGDDVYRISSTAITTVITETSGQDTIELVGVSSSNISIYRDASSLYIKHDGELIVTVKDYFADSNNSIEYVVFSNENITWEAEKLLAEARVSSLGPDYIDGSSSNELLLGKDGNDVIYGNAGNDTLDGGVGNDLLSGNSGSDTYIFNIGYGIDIISDYDKNINNVDVIKLGLGITTDNIKIFREGYNLVIKFDGYPDDKIIIQDWGKSLDSTIEKLQFDNGVIWNIAYLKSIQWQTSSGADYVQGFLSDDSISSGDGDDTIHAGDGKDFVDSGSGNDLIFGDAGADIIYAFDGDDTVYGGISDDTIEGMLGNDLLYGDQGNDSIHGTEGSDTLVGGSGNDELFGDQGDDVFIFHVGDGKDTITAGEGVDTLMFEDIQFTDITHIGTGGYYEGLVIYYGDNDSVTINLQTLEPDNAAEFLQFQDGTYSFSQLLATKPIYMDSNDVRFFMDVESKTIYGSKFNDTITTTGGNNTINGGLGDDFILTGNWPLTNGTTFDDILMGDVGNDTLRSGVGDDTLIGGVGDDSLEAAEGNDLIIIGRNEGRDIINNYHTDSSTDILQFADGINQNDLMFMRTGSDLNIFFNGYAASVNIQGYYQSSNYKIDQIKFSDDSILNNTQIEFLEEFKPSTPFHLLGTENGDYLTSGSGNDTIESFGGNDLVDGGAGNDLIVGGLGDDTLVGGDDNDYLYGGNGNDYLSGGEGQDTYYFELGDGQDVIYAFDEGATRNEILEFGSSIESSQITLIKSGEDLVFSFIGSNDSVTIQNYFSSFLGTDGVFSLNEVRFSDGSTWNQDDILQNISSEVPNDPNQIPFVLGSGLVTQTLEDVTGGEGTSQYTVYFGNNVNLSDLTITREVHDLIITHANGVDQLRLNGVYIRPNNHMRIDGLFSSQGMTFDLSILALGITGTEADDNLIGQDEGDNYITGLGGSDNLSSGNGHDTLDGGEGNDTLSAGIGNDRYEFFGNIGHDVVLESPQTGENFDYDIIYIEKLSTDVTLSRAGDNLVLILGPDDSVTLQDWYGPNGAVFEEVQFSDLSWDKTTLIALAENLPSQSSNQPPVINQVITEASVTEDSQFTLDFTTAFSDSDVQDELSYGLTLENGDPLPSWMNFDPLTRVLSGLPGNAEVGSINLKITATDLAGESATQTFVLAVTNANDAPMLVGSIENQQVVDGNTYTYTIPSTLFQDVDVGDALTLSISQSNQSHLPTWLTFDPLTLTLSGSPSAADIATPLNLTVTASDTSGSSVSTSFTLTVAAMASQSLVGTSGNDVLIGGSGNDTLNGGTGADSMSGGYGNDLYIVDNSGDVITESAGEGSDTVQSSISYSLGANVENLTLTGSGATLGTGNALANVIIGNSGNNTLRGNAGADTLNGGAGTDTVTYSGQNPSVRVNLTTGLGKGGDAEGDVYISIENVTDSWSNDLIIGSSVANRLDGTSGNDILQGLSGNDSLADSYGRNVLDGGDGHDYIYDSDQSELVIGGKGNDEIYTGAGQDVISFNKGDGVDDYYGGAATDNTLSLGGDFSYNELSFSKSGNDLVLNVGTSQINLKSWYAATPIKSVLNLQVIAEAMSDFNASGTNTMLDNKVEKFDFIGIVNQFDTALAADANLTSWSLTNALLDYHLGGSDTAAIGGDLAYQYGLNGSLAGIGLSAAQSVINSSSFGQSAQTLHASTSWQSETTKLA